MKIGMFDSGYGGLTILRELVNQLPQYSYIYLGDNARAPYGDRAPEEIHEFTKQGVDYLFKQGSTLVILACNTASAVALRRLQQEWLPEHYPDHRILGILVPTVEQITGVPWSNKEPALSASLGTITVGVLATEQTVRSGAYEMEIHKRNLSIKVVPQACPGLVAAIEQDAPAEKITIIVAGCLQQLQQHVTAQRTTLHAVLLGCTHYELIADMIRQQLPAEVELYEQPVIVAKSLAEYLAAHENLVAQFEQASPPVFLTTGDPARISANSQRYFGEAVSFDRITLR
jgi:glutamate racemase